MSSHDKDPQQKQDTSSESSESKHSDSEIDEAEENLREHLKIAERRSKEAPKDDSDESKPLDSPTQEGTLTSQFDLLNEPIAGPSGLQESHLASSYESSGQGSKVASSSDPQEKKVGTKGVDAKMVEGESHSSNSQSYIQSSAGPSIFRGDIDLLKYPYRIVAARFMNPSRSSSAKHQDYISDSASTSADISEIRSEIADSSTDGSVYHDAPEVFEKEESPSFVSALERQLSSEASDTNISEIQDFVPTPESSIASASTPSGEQGHRAYLAQLHREADARGLPISTSSGIGSTDQSELANLQAWNLVGEMGSYRRNVDDPNQDILGAEGCEPLPTSESIEDEPNLIQQMQDFDSLFQQEQQNVEEMDVSKDAKSKSSARRLQVENSDQVSAVGAGSPYKRRRSSKYLGDASEAEEEISEKQRPRYKQDPGKKSKMAISKSCPVLQSSSESPEPKTSSSDELHRKDSPEFKSASETGDISKSVESRKLHQIKGRLRYMQHPTMSSMDSVLEEEDQASVLREQDTGLMETKEPTLEIGETSLQKVSEGSSEITESSETKPSTVSSDQAYRSETERTLKEHEQSFEDTEFERSAGKSKREPKLSNSPQSDEKLDSSPPKAATNRPKKRAKSDKMPMKPRRTRHDSGGNVPKSVSLGNLKQSESTSTPDVSDYTPSDEEKEAQS